jgi:hypothetical protein
MDMNARSHWPWVLSIVFITLIFFTTLCISNNSTNNNQTNGEEPIQNLEILYLNSIYLSPTKAGIEESNKVELTATKNLSFSHSIRDRKFNKNLKPEIMLWLDSHGKANLKLRFEIGFQAWEEDTLIEGKFFKILFNNYTTIGNPYGENISLSYLRYDGEPFDIKSGSTNFASVYFSISLNNTGNSDKIDIYTGADGKASFIKVPYDNTLSASAKNDDNGGDSTPGFTLESLLLILVIFFIFRHSRLKK